MPDNPNISDFTTTKLTFCSKVDFAHYDFKKTNDKSDFLDARRLKRFQNFAGLDILDFWKHCHFTEINLNEMGTF